MIVPERIRNIGYSLGLEHPYIYGKLCLDKLEEHSKIGMSAVHELARLMNGTWCVWNRHTGGIVFESEHENKVLAEVEAKKKCHELNGLNPNVVSQDVLNEIDMEA